MSYTAQEIYEMAIVILDELTDTGQVSPTQSKEYMYRAPRLLDMWQHEMAASGDLYNTAEYINSDENSTYKWIKYDAPAKMKWIKEVIFVDSDSQITSIQYRQFGRSNIYLYFTNTGTVRMSYIPIPDKITALTQTLEIDEINAISGAYYLAEHFAMADQNTELAAMCKQKFAELKASSDQKKPNAQQQIVDVYGISDIR